MFKESKAMKTGLIVAIVAAVAYFVSLATPLNSGVPYAPGRLVLGYIWTVIRLGLVFMSWGWFAAHKTWLMPWYQEGDKVEVFSSTRVVRIALIAAATIVFAFVKIPVLGWSIRPVPVAFAFMYFGYVEGALGGWIGYMISTLIVGGYEDPMIMLPAMAWGDILALGLFGLFYWAWIREEPAAGTRTKRYVMSLGVAFLVWYVDLILQSIGYLGAAVIIPYAIQYLVGGFMVLAIVIIVAVGAVETMKRTQKKKGA